MESPSKGNRKGINGRGTRARRSRSPRHYECGHPGHNIFLAWYLTDVNLGQAFSTGQDFTAALFSAGTLPEIFRKPFQKKQSSPAKKYTNQSSKMNVIGEESSFKEEGSEWEIQEIIFAQGPSDSLVVDILSSGLNEGEVIVKESIEEQQLQSLELEFPGGPLKPIPHP